MRLRLLLLGLLVGCNSGDLTDDDSAADDDTADDDDVADDDTGDDDTGDDDTGDDDVADDDDDDTGDTGDDDSSAPLPGTVAACFAEFSAAGGPDYDQFGPVVGSHCQGTNHQDITGVERVVFLGDSVTVGTPPSLDSQLYRTILTNDLADRFWLDVPGLPWPGVDLINGVAYDSWGGNQGDFDSCAKWGGRVDDLHADNQQIDDCIPPSERSKQHLVVMTAGGNDIASLTQHGADGWSNAQLWDQVDQWVDDFEDAIAYLTDPVAFPVRPFVVYGNNYEFTDATGDVASCQAAGLANFSTDQWQDPTAQETMIVYALEQYARIAVEYQVDMLFTFENFCGHGYHRDDPNGRCYRGPNAELWFDLTCIHPNPAGHAALAAMFDAVVDE